MFVKYEHIQQWRGGDIRLSADFGETLLGCGIGHADCGPVIEELAARRMLCNGFKGFDYIIPQRLRLEFADGTTFQQSVNGGIVKKIAHVTYFRPFCRITQGCLGSAGRGFRILRQ